MQEAKLNKALVINFKNSNTFGQYFHRLKDETKIFKVKKTNQLKISSKNRKRRGLNSLEAFHSFSSIYCY